MQTYGHVAETLCFAEFHQNGGHRQLAEDLNFRMFPKHSIFHFPNGISQG
jgi:hypothetical protein